MDEYLALFPFTRAASEYVKSSGRVLEDLVKGEDFSKEVLTRSSQRIKQALEGEIELVKLEEENKVDIELLSYPLARVMVSCINNHLLTQRYANGEARFAFQKLKSASDDEAIKLINKLLEDFNIIPEPLKDPKTFENSYTFHFTDFVRFTSRLRDSKWKLVNVMVEKGRVELAKNEVMEILQEKIRLEVLSDLPLKLSRQMCQSISSYTKDILSTFDVSVFRSWELGAIDEEAYPPCIRELISLVKSGKNLAHPARFALTAFLANIGMSAEEIVRFYESSPDFDLELTRYQVEHIMGSSGTEYTSPGCSTMETYGNCAKGGEICKSISHPLSYYRKKLARKRSSARSNEKYTSKMI
jgi:DNA primase large subunit